MSTTSDVFSPSKFRALRRKANLTMEELAEKISVSRSAIGHWETGRSVPSEEKIDHICRALGVDSFSFFVESVTSSDQKSVFPRSKTLGDIIPPAMMSIIDECMELSGIDGDYEGFIIDCIYRRWTDLKRSEPLINAMKQSVSKNELTHTSAEKTNKNKLKVDKNN